MLGIVYWFWTQVNYLQRKVNLLDNIVYEMKTFISNLPGQSAGNTIQPPLKQDDDDEGNGHVMQESEGLEQEQEESPVPTVYNAPPESVAGDLEAERLASEIEFEPFSGAAQNQESNDDLQPGGLASGSSPGESKKIAVFSESAIESPLSSMSIKELRRMAEANNIPGSAELRKRDLIKALRDKVGQIIGQDKGHGQEQAQGSGSISAMEGVISFDDVGAPNSE